MERTIEIPATISRLDSLSASIQSGCNQIKALIPDQVIWRYLLMDGIRKDSSRPAQDIDRAQEVMAKIKSEYELVIDQIEPHDDAISDLIMMLENMIKGVQDFPDFSEDDPADLPAKEEDDAAWGRYFSEVEANSDFLSLKPERVGDIWELVQQSAIQLDAHGIATPWERERHFERFLKTVESQIAHMKAVYALYAQFKATLG